MEPAQVRLSALELPLARESQHAPGPNGADATRESDLARARATPPRIAIIRQKFRLDGGGERIVQLMREILAKQGHDVTLIAREWQGEGSTEKILRCNPARWTRVQRESRFAREALLLARQDRFDLVQSHERIPGCTLYRAGDGVHRCWLEQRGRQLGPVSRQLLRCSRFHRYMLRAEREMFEHPNLQAVICNSGMVRDEIANHFRIDPQKLFLIHNGVDTARFHPRLKSMRDPLREQLLLPLEAPVFLLVGSGWERKGLTQTLHALASVPTAHLVVVGRDKAHAKYRRLIARLGLTARVRLAGVQADVAPYYGAADALVLPALYDPFPNAILEAMAAGLPVLTSPKCGAIDFIRNGENGFVCDPFDQETLIEALRQLTDFNLSARLGANARVTVEPYTPDFLESQLSRLYDNVLARISRPVNTTGLLTSTN